jgi:hypothetical protein
MGRSEDENGASSPTAGSVTGGLIRATSAASVQGAVANGTFPTLGAAAG